MTNLVVDQSQLESAGSTSHLKSSGFKADHQLKQPHDIADSPDGASVETEPLKNASPSGRPSPEVEVVAPELVAPSAEDDPEQRSTRHTRHHRSVKRKYDQLTASRLR